MLKKATKDNRGINLAIPSWCNTPTAGGHYRPVQKLHSRRTRTQLPTASKLLKPRIVGPRVCPSPSSVKAKLQTSEVMVYNSLYSAPSECVRVQYQIAALLATYYFGCAMQAGTYIKLWDIYHSICNSFGVLLSTF